MNHQYKLFEETYLDRLIKERDDLNDRLEKLKNFLASDKSDHLATMDLIDLGIQEKYMTNLLTVLNRRLIRATLNESKNQT